MEVTLNLHDGLRFLYRSVLKKVAGPVFYIRLSFEGRQTDFMPHFVMYCPLTLLEIFITIGLAVITMFGS